VPRPTDDGRTYTFRIRSGIRYSTGAPVRPSDFVRSVTREFVARSPGRDDLMALRGAGRCRRTPAACDLARGVDADDRLGTVTFHLAAPDPDFLMELTDFAFAAPLPAGVPDHDSLLHPLPGTGPYRIASATHERIVFTRNPYFREWSHAAQPAGNPDRIVWQLLSSHRRAIDAVLRGDADWSVDAISPQQLQEVRSRFPAQVHSEAIDAVEFLPLDTRLAPFDHAQVRRALDLAIDRSRIARMYGGSFVATPTCQALVPGLLGYRRYCPWTRDPGAGDAYRGPDLARARRLVARSGTRGEHVTVLGARDELVVPGQLTDYVGQVLRSIGYRVTTRFERYDRITPQQQETAQILTYGDWLPDYPAASSYLPSFFGCDGVDSNRYVCDPTLDREMRRANAAQLSRPAVAARLWAQADRRITDRAYWVPTVTDRWVDVVSRRLANYQVSPVWGFIADQAVVG
jgi:peptide/nickel transport system substrate-binding protein